MSSFIVDASVAIKWVIPEKGTAEALTLLGNRLLAPTLLQSECASILWKKVRRGEISAREGGIAARLLENFEIEFCAPEPDLSQILELALALGHPAYDCVYLTLAEARGVPLVTADQRLVRVAREARQFSGVLDNVSVVPLFSRPTVH